MKEQIKIVIENDYYGEGSNMSYHDEIDYFVNEMNIFAEIRNNNYNNIIEEAKRYSSDKEDYDSHIVVGSKGYSQGDWQDTIIYYNKDEVSENDLSNLTLLIERMFTHKHDYSVTKYSVIEYNNKKYETIEDYTSFCITNTEFPNKEDIMKEYDAIYGEDYDLFEINAE